MPIVADATVVDILHKDKHVDRVRAAGVDPSVSTRLERTSRSAERALSGESLSLMFHEYLTQDRHTQQENLL